MALGGTLRSGGAYRRRPQRSPRAVERGLSTCKFRAVASRLRSPASSNPGSARIEIIGQLAALAGHPAPRAAARRRGLRRGWPDRSRPRAPRSSVPARRAMAPRVAGQEQSRRPSGDCSAASATPPEPSQTVTHHEQRVFTIEEARDFLAANPAVQWIDAFVLDMNGHPRGKRLRRDDLVGVAKGGMMLPGLRVHHGPARQLHSARPARLWTTGDPDYNFRILSWHAWRPCLVDGDRASRRHVIVREGRSPRSSLRAAEAGRALQGRRPPVAAVELE